MPPRAPPYAAVLFLIVAAVPVLGLRDEAVTDSLAEEAESVGGRMPSWWCDNFTDGLTSQDTEPEHMGNQLMTGERNPRYCQFRCKVTIGCNFFMWKRLKEDYGECYVQAKYDTHSWSSLLSKANASQRHTGSSKRSGSVNNDPEADLISGFKDCRPVVNASAVDNRASCYNINIAYDRDLTSKGEPRTVVSAPHDCLERCRKLGDHCSYYSWFQDGGCHVHPSNAIARWYENAISGPANCSTCVDARKRRSGALTTSEDIKAETQEVCRERCGLNTNTTHFSFRSNHECHCHGKGAWLEDDQHAVTGPVKCMSLRTEAGPAPKSATAPSNLDDTRDDELPSAVGLLGALTPGIR